MQLFQIIQMLDKDIESQKCKIHLACWNGRVNPLDEYLAGKFDTWQSRQNRKNFQRDFVVSLIALGSNQWLFVGVYESEGCEWVQEGSYHEYRLESRAGFDGINGRLVVQFERPGRQSYLNAENWVEQLTIAEIRARKVQIADFPGFSRAMLTKQHLDIVVQQNAQSWKAALENVAGVYVIADRKTGKLYVGGASGEGGIWCRWRAYSETGHGGNLELRELLKHEGHGYAENFQFGVLEIADTHASRNDILRRESYWKNLLLSRTHGYNAN